MRLQNMMTRTCCRGSPFRGNGLIDSMASPLSCIYSTAAYSSKRGAQRHSFRACTHWATLYGALYGGARDVLAGYIW